MAKYRKLPVEIEAMQFTEESKDKVFYQFITCQRYPGFDADGNPVLNIQTLEGVMTARLGDWVIKGVAGEFYSCKDGIFRSTYEPVEEEQP